MVIDAVCEWGQSTYVPTDASDYEWNEVPSSLLHKHLQVEEDRYPEAGYKDDGRGHGRLIPIENESCGFRHFAKVRTQDTGVKEGKERMS